MGAADFPAKSPAFLASLTRRTSQLQLRLPSSLPPLPIVNFYFIYFARGLCVCLVIFFFFYFIFFFFIFFFALSLLVFISPAAVSVVILLQPLLVSYLYASSRAFPLRQLQREEVAAAATVAATTQQQQQRSSNTSAT